MKRGKSSARSAAVNPFGHFSAPSCLRHQKNPNRHGRRRHRRSGFELETGSACVHGGTSIIRLSPGQARGKSDDPRCHQLCRAELSGGRGDRPEWCLAVSDALPGEEAPQGPCFFSGRGLAIHDGLVGLVWVTLGRRSATSCGMASYSGCNATRPAPMRVGCGFVRTAFPA